MNLVYYLTKKSSNYKLLDYNNEDFDFFEKIKEELIK